MNPLCGRVTAAAEETKFLEVRIGAKGTTKRRRVKAPLKKKFLGVNRREKIPRCKENS